MNIPPLAYLRAKAIIVPAPPGLDVKGDCWLWPNVPQRQGYGTINWNGTTHRVHRVAYLASGKTIPDGLGLDHLCRRRICFNPDHVEPCTQRENVLRSPDTVAGKHARKTHCKNGHPFDAENTIILNTERGWRDCRICRRARTQKANRKMRDKVRSVG